MPTPLPGTTKSTSVKSKWLTFAILVVLFIGVPAVFIYINRNTPVDPNANLVTIDYYKAGVKTNIPETSAAYATMKNDTDALVGFADSYSRTAGSSADAAQAKNSEAIEITFGSSQHETFLNSNLSSVDYKRLLIVPMPDRSTVKLLFGYDTYTTEQAFYNGSWADTVFEAARGYKPAVNQ